jgi:HEPN domain-containing protein
MATAEQLNHAKAFLKKAEDYLGSAEDNLIAGRYTPAAGDAVHAGISAKDSIVTALTGATAKSKDHATAAKELKTALGKHAQAATAERSLRELIAAKGEVEYGTALITKVKAEPLVRRARSLVELATEIVRLRR